MESFDGFFCGGAIDAQEMVDQKGDVAVTFAQRWNEDGHDIDAEIEVFAEPAFADGVFEIFVGRGNQAEIDFARDAAAEALHRAFLQDAQEFALEVGIKGGDFIEKERAVVSRFDHAGFSRIGAGEGALFVAEEFRLHQGFGEGGAVEADEGMIGAVAALDDGLRDEFLAYAAFAAKDDGGAGAGDSFNGLIDLLHSRAAADEAMEGGFAFDLLEEAAAFEFEGALFDGAGEDDLQLGKVQGKEEEFIGAGLAGFQGDGAAVGLGEGDDDDVVANLAHFGEDVEAVGCAIADAIKIEEDGVELGEFQGGFDFAFGGGESGAELSAEVLADFGEKLIVVGNDGEGIAFRAGGWFGQSNGFRS